MNNLTKKNIAYSGLLVGFIVSIICILSPFPRGMMVLYQLLAVIVASITIGYILRGKVQNSTAASLFGAIFTLGASRVLSFVNEDTPLLFAIFLSTMGVIFFFLFSKYFSLELNKFLKYVIATILFLIWFFFIPLLELYIARSTFTR